MIDASGMIVMPGFVDSHRHIWEGLLRNIGTDVPLEGRTSYISFVLHKLAPAFRPEDAYVGNLVGARGDRRGYHDAARLVAHPGLARPHRRGDPGAERLRAACGLRLRVPVVGKWEERQPSWFVRAATEHFSTKDQKLTLALAAPGPEFTDFEVTRDHWSSRARRTRASRPRRRRELRAGRKVQEFGEAGLLGPDTTYIHCTTLNDTEIQMIVDTGGTVSLASPVEMMMGHGMPPIQKFLDRGLRPSLSVDVETNVPGDMFNQMRSVLGLQRAIASAQGQDARRGREVLEYATVEGAGPTVSTPRSARSPGKQADLIMLNPTGSTSRSTTRRPPSSRGWTRATSTRSSSPDG